MADTTIQYDADGVTPTSMNYITFRRLTTLPPAKRAGEETRLAPPKLLNSSKKQLLNRGNLKIGNFVENFIL